MGAADFAFFVGLHKNDFLYGIAEYYRSTSPPVLCKVSIGKNHTGVVSSTYTSNSLREIYFLKAEAFKKHNSPALGFDGDKIFIKLIFIIFNIIK